MSSPVSPDYSTLTKAAAGGIAIVPCFYGFAAKNAHQLGRKLDPMTFSKVVRGGLTIAPSFTTLLAIQLEVQKCVNEQTQNSAIASIVAGAVSSPFLAIFNGQGMGMNMRQSLRNMSLKQAGTITAREGSFLFALEVDKKIKPLVKQTLGESKGAEYGAAFVTGVIGSLCGQVFDTPLTLWQKGMEVERWSHLARGAPARAITIGSFFVLFKGTQEIFEYLKKAQA